MQYFDKLSWKMNSKIYTLSFLLFTGIFIHYYIPQFTENEEVYAIATTVLGLVLGVGIISDFNRLNKVGVYVAYVLLSAIMLVYGMIICVFYLPFKILDSVMGMIFPFVLIIIYWPLYGVFNKMFNRVPNESDKGFGAALFVAASIISGLLYVFGGMDVIILLQDEFFTW